MAKPEHGTYARSVHCKPLCGPCEQARRDYARNRARLIAYGQWNPWVDAEPVRLHVKEIQAAGIGLPHLAIVSGVGQATLNRLIYGEPGCSRPPTRKMRPWVAEQILAVTTASGALAGRVRVDATGTRRRLQALVSLGWTLEQLGKGIGASASAVYRALQSETVKAARASSVADLYERLWDKRPILVTTNDKSNATRARRLAAARGWAPPMAWDDDTIDDPNAEPEGVEPEVGHHRKLPPADELMWLVEDGATPEALAQRFGSKVSTVLTAIHRARSRSREAVAA